RLDSIRSTCVERFEGPVQCASYFGDAGRAGAKRIIETDCVGDGALSSCDSNDRLPGPQVIHELRWQIDARLDSALDQDQHVSVHQPLKALLVGGWTYLRHRVAHVASFGARVKPLRPRPGMNEFNSATKRRPLPKPLCPSRQKS